MEHPATPSFRLDGRRALVTGAGRGIGLAAAAALAEAGAHVTLVARSGDEIADAAAAICAFGILVNNAGTNRPKPMTEVSADDYDAVLGLNVRSAFFVAQAMVRRLAATGTPGSLIHMGSQTGHVGGPNRSLYCASKWALEGMSKAFALDLAAHGIRSNTIAPTFIETPMTQLFFADAAFKASVLAKVKLGRIRRVEDLIGAIVYLASDASALVTGASLLVDGGWMTE